MDRRSLEGYHPRGHKKSDTTELLNNSENIIYMWNLKYDTNEPICETERTDLLPREWSGGGGKRWELKNNKCKHVYIGWI